MQIESNNGILNNVAMNTVTGALTGAAITGAFSLYAQNAAINQKDAFISKEHGGITKFLLDDVYGGEYKKQLGEVAQKGAFNFKSIAKSAGKNALIWGGTCGVFELAWQLVKKGYNSINKQ